MCCAVIKNCIFCFGGSTRVAYGSSQARSCIRATAASHSHSGSEPHLWHLWHCQILNPLSDTRGRTCVLIDTNQILNHWATMGTPSPDHWSIAAEHLTTLYKWNFESNLIGFRGKWSFLFFFFLPEDWGAISYKLHILQNAFFQKVKYRGR